MNELKNKIEEIKVLGDELEKIIKNSYEKRFYENTPIDFETVNEISKIRDFLDFQYLVGKAFLVFLEKNNVEYTREIKDTFEEFFTKLEKEIFERKEK